MDDKDGWWQSMLDLQTDISKRYAVEVTRLRRENSELRAQLASFPSDATAAQGRVTMLEQMIQQMNFPCKEDRGGGECQPRGAAASPGAAWAAFVDDPKYGPDMKKELAKDLASWVRNGANVQRVSVQQARDMLSAWVRPEKKTNGKTSQLGLI